MGLFTSKQLNSLQDLFVDQICDLYDAEQRVIDALPKMSEAAHSPELKRALNGHLNETKQQCMRLEDIFHDMGMEPNRVTCDGMKGIISEGESILDADGDPDVKDAAIIGAAQRVEHYEIAGYGCARTFAQRLGYQHAAELLQENLNEEGQTDKRLTQLAEQSVNVKAQYT